MEIKNLESLEKLTKKELIDIAKELKLSNYSKLVKQELAELIFKSQASSEAVEEDKKVEEVKAEIVEEKKLETETTLAGKEKKSELYVSEGYVARGNFDFSFS